MSEMQTGIIKELRRQIKDLEAKIDNWEVRYRLHSSRCERIEAELKTAKELVRDIVRLTAGKGDD